MSNRSSNVKNRAAPLPYAPPVLLPGLAGLCSTFASRALLREGSLRFVYEPVSAAPAAAFGVEAGGFLFGLEFATLDFLAAHEALEGADISRLPEAVRLAALEMVLQPFQEALETAFNTTLMPLASGQAPTDWLNPPFHFIFDFTHADGRKWAVGFCLRIASEEGARWLADRVQAALPQVWRNPARGSWPIATTLLAGAMRVPLGVLNDLAIADILLPPKYPASKGQLFLAISGDEVFRLSLSGQNATVVDRTRLFFDGRNHSVSSDDNNPPATAAAPAKEEALVDHAALEVTIHFELEKKLLPLSELESLSPGKTFALGVDPRAAVTLTLNGQALAQGRLVDLDGTLGVQITRLSDTPRHD
ncbi:MAG: type III secretion system cytoplasmic ring protein SctQ [Zoogloeaceae bacterium]|jgi:type III secretion protein Q|nr:type III secretion system cytoplasmic ring protein SctQ [Zoogloeaceae bacterium]